MVRRVQVFVPVLAALMCAGSESSNGQPVPTLGTNFVVGTYARRPDRLQEEPGLSAAIADLREAVVRRDVTLIEPWLAADVGWAECPVSRSVVLAEMRKWKAEEWEKLGESLRLGAAMVGTDSAIVPFTVEAISEGEVSDSGGFGMFAAAEETTAIHVGPDSTSAVIATVQRAVLALDKDGDASQPWARVKATQGQTGYVLWSALSGTPDGETVWFQRRDDGWRIVAFGLTC